MPRATQLVDEEVGRHRDHDRALASGPDVGEHVGHPTESASGCKRLGHLRRCQVGPQLVDGAGESLRVELARAEARLQRVQLVEVARDPGQLQAGGRRRQQRAVEVEHVQGTHRLESVTGAT